MDTPEPKPIALEPDLDDVCYRFAQAILRMIEEEDTANGDQQKMTSNSDNQTRNEQPDPDVDSKEMPIDH